MSKDKISDYSATANSNTDIGGINIDEGCAPSGINDAIRTLMKQLKDFQQGTQSDVFKGPLQVGAASSIEVTDNSNAALRITQLGTGNALLVEDSTNPDSTPFVIDASGAVIAGYTSQIDTYRFQTATSNGVNQSNFRFSADTGGPIVKLGKSRSATVGTNSLVSSGDSLGSVRAFGADGSDYIEAARIEAAVDGTPGTGDMPGRLVFSTTADGASSPTERVRIDNAGKTVIGGSQAYSADGDTQQLQVHGLTQATSSALLANWSTSASSEPNLILAHSRSGVVGTQTASVSGDNLGNITFCGSDGSAFEAGVLIFAEADGTWSGSSRPSKVTFYTVPSGSTGAVEAISLTSGQGLQISRTAVTTPATGDGNVFSGTYTPTLTNTTNITASTAITCQYMRVGNTVTVSGQVSGITMTSAAATSTVLKMTLPIASALGSIRQVGGTAVFYSSASRGTAVAIYGDATNDIAEFNWAAPTTTASQAFTFSFTYLVQ